MGLLNDGLGDFKEELYPTPYFPNLLFHPSRVNTKNEEAKKSAIRKVKM